MVAEQAVKSGAVLRQGTEAVAPLVQRRPRHRRGREGQGVGPHVRAAGPLRRGRRRRQLALRPCARHQPQPVVPAGHGHPRLLRQRHQRRRRGSRARSTCATATATPSPATAGSSRWATATINVGIGLLSTFRDFKSRQHHPPHERVRRHRSRALGHLARVGHVGARPAGGCPMGGSVGPKVGPDLDRRRRRGRLDQPVQRRGHRLRLRDRAHGGRRCSTRRCRPATAWCCSATRAMLDAEYGQYFKVARLFAKVIGHPALMRELTRVGMQLAHAHGVGAAHHGQPAARRRARPGRGGLPLRRRSSPASSPNQRG